MNLVLDWDGTCTLRDSLVDAVDRFGDRAVFEREFTSFGESLSAEIGTIRATAAEVSGWAREHVRIRPGLRELVALHRPVIVSSGLPQLILPVLEREGLDPEVRCNQADPDPAGWRLRFRDDAPCPVCGDRCKRASLPAATPLVYVGDGISDRCAARAADRVFARSWLAGDLESAGIPFTRFETLHDVAAALS